MKRSPAEVRKAAEIAHGKRIAAQSEKVWQRDTPAGRLRMEHRFADLVSFLSLLPNNRLLEIGAGSGTWTELLARLPVDIVSIDLSPDLLELAKKRITSNHVQLLTADAEHLPFDSASFEAVCGLSILHHLDMDRVLPEIHRVLKRNGKIWFSEPNMLNPQIMIQKNIPPIKRWLGDTPDETAFFRWPLKKLLTRHGFQVIEVRPFDFLHPQIPAFLTRWVDAWGKRFEKVPFLKEFGGSVLIHAFKNS